MERCRICGGRGNDGKLQGGICLECQVSIMQEGFRRRRAVEVGKIMRNPLYHLKKRIELDKDKRAAWIFDLRTANQINNQYHEMDKGGQNGKHQN